jgi:site-specific recombinase XerC
MGHADISTTMIYVHHVPQVDAAQKLTKVFDAGSGAGADEPAKVPHA